MNNVRDELKLFGSNQTEERRRKYFLWKNGIDTMRVNYSELTQEEFIKLACETEKQFDFLVRWAEGEEYKRLVYILKQSKFDDDILEVYDSIKKSAKEGNATAVKTMLDLQKEISNRLKSYSEIEEIEESLKLDI